MFDKEAIEALQYGGGIKEASEATEYAFAAPHHLVGLPDHFTVHDLEQFLPHRRRMRGRMQTSSIEDFVVYTTLNHEDGATVFVDAGEMRATAVLNLGNTNAAGHADNTATLNLQPTAAYLALKRIVDGKRAQRDVAEFIEDWIGLVECFSDDEKLQPKQAIAAVRAVTIEGLRRTESQEQSLSASRGTFESVTASSKTPLPTFIYFTCEPYQGLSERTFVLRLGVITSDEKPALLLRVVKAEEHQEEMARELTGKVRDRLVETLVPVLIGTYQPK